MFIAAADPRSRSERRLRMLLLFLWAAATLWMAATHVFWRDEVRAFSIALRGGTVADMLRGLQGEGHPALWYLLLRGFHTLWPAREALPAAAFLVAASAMALLALRSPFRAGIVALVMFGAFGFYEYTVSARNYGIAMLALFVIAWAYPRRRDSGVLMGVLLALLCNTNVPACFFAAGLLLFWVVELIGEEGLRWTPRKRAFLVAAALAAAGAAAAFVTVFPTVNDAAVAEHPGGITLAGVAAALLTPAASFGDLAPRVIAGSPLAQLLLGLALFGSLLGLVRAPGALLASLFVLAALEAMFQLVYPGSYRHQALYLVWLVAMYWLVLEGRGGRWPERWRVPERTTFLQPLGAALFAALLFAQLPNAFLLAAGNAAGYPASRAADLARLLEREKLLDATLIADPDVMLEPMPYYVPNPIFLLRERKFGNVVRFTRHARTRLGLGALTDDAEALAARTGRPVVIVLQHPLKDDAPQVLPQGYGGEFTSTPEEVRRFRAATRRLAAFPPAVGDESYEVFLLTGGRPQVQPRRAAEG